MTVAHRFRYLLFTLIWVISLIAMPAMWAAPGCVDADDDGFDKYHRKLCPDGEDLDDNDPCDPNPGATACSGGSGGGGDTTITAQDLEALWSGDLYSVKRTCSTHYLNLANGTVNIECGHGPANPAVELRFSSGDFLASGRSAELCDMLFQGLVFGPESETNRLSSFIMSSGPEWNGDACLDDGEGTTRCRIWVRNTAYGKLCTLAEQDAGECGDRLIVMTGFGLANPAPVVDGVAELNPFTVEQDIALNELTFDIKGIGKNRTDATCTADFSMTTVTFHTRPIAP